MYVRSHESRCFEKTKFSRICGRSGLYGPRNCGLAAALSRPVRLLTWWPQPTALQGYRLGLVDHDHHKSHDALSCRAALSPDTLLLRKMHWERVTVYVFVHGKMSFKDVQKHF